MRIPKHYLFVGNCKYQIFNKQASKMKLTFNQILISRNKVMLSSNNMVVTCTTIENKKVIISDEKLQVIV